ncbi:MAG TPA: CooT family nickel-binding protein [Desulfobacteria bacterium]|nr:CooT family nickel-binding protein [Desulfobacteria bacterium]
MCEANAYLKNGETEELLMEQVDIIESFGNGLRLVDIFGKQKLINARIKDMNLLNHRILLEQLEVGGEENR